MGNMGGLVGNVGGGKRTPVLAMVGDSTRTYGTWTAPVSGVIAVTSDADIVITPPSGTSKTILSWEVYCEDVGGGRGIWVVYRDVDGGGFTIMPNARVGADLTTGITGNAFDNVATLGSNTSISITDQSPVVGGVHTYRLYWSATSANTVAIYFNMSQGNGREGLCTFTGVCI